MRLMGISLVFLMFVHKPEYWSNWNSDLIMPLVEKWKDHLKLKKKVSRIYSVGRLNICSKSHNNQSNGCQYIFYLTSKIATSWWRYTVVSAIHYLGSMNVCTKFHGNPFISWDILEWNKVWTDPQSSSATEAKKTNSKLTSLLYALKVMYHKKNWNLQEFKLHQQKIKAKKGCCTCNTLWTTELWKVQSKITTSLPQVTQMTVSKEPLWIHLAFPVSSQHNTMICSFSWNLPLLVGQTEQGQVRCHKVGGLRKEMHLEWDFFYFLCVLACINVYVCLSEWV